MNISKIYSPKTINLHPTPNTKPTKLQNKPNIMKKPKIRSWRYHRLLHLQSKRR